MIKIKNDFDLKGSLFSGQCFRMFEDNGFIYTIIKDRVLKIKEEKDFYIIYSSREDNLEEVIYEYFDLKKDYKKLNRELIKRDSLFKDLVNDKHRILKQDKLEIFISYIISQNNNVKRISYSVNKLCECFGKKINYDEKEFYLFPTMEKILGLNIEDLKVLKIGFRDKYIMNAINVLKKDKYFLSTLENLITDEAMEELIKIKGIGPKVASCILMFGFSRFDAYPIDTWAKKYLTERFNIKNLSMLRKKLYEMYGKNVGLAVQYMFDYERNRKKSTKN